MPKHITRIILLIVVLLTIGFSAKAYFTVDTFYDYGHYRGAAVTDIATSHEPRYRGPDYCKMCHVDQHAVWSANGHKTNKCEACHGPAGQHPVTGKLPIPQDSVKLCTQCHEKITGRPAKQPQVVVAEHAGTMACIFCHDPHKPRPIRIKEVAAK